MEQARGHMLCSAGHQTTADPEPLSRHAGMRSALLGTRHSTAEREVWAQGAPCENINDNTRV